MNLSQKGEELREKEKGLRFADPLYIRGIAYSSQFVVHELSAPRPLSLISEEQQGLHP